MTEKTSADYDALKNKVEELAKGPKDRSVVEARLRELSRH